MTITTTGRGITNNQATFDVLISKIFLFNNSYLADQTYKNTTGALESVVPGTVVGRIALTQEIAAFKSDATDGSEIPIGIMRNEITDLAIGGTVQYIAPCNGGQVNEDLLVFVKTGDTLDTLVGGVSVRDLLIRNSKDLELKKVSDDTGYDN